MQSETVLQVKAVSKSFPGVRALDGVELELKRGEVHAVVGENGAGKSTLMGILAGLYEPDSGSILRAGRSVRIKSPHNALKLGIAMIHQELLPFPDLTVAENIFIGQEPLSSVLPGWIDYPQMNEAARLLLRRLKVDLKPDTKMRQLRIAQMQMVEIAKAIAHNADIIIMDEPTSAISAAEIDALLEVVGDLQCRGVSLIYVSHKLEEIFSIAQRITVLRDGKYVGTFGRNELTPDKLIKLMVGRDVTSDTKQPPRKAREIALSVRGLSHPGHFNNVSFDLHYGEILGVAGLMGAGRTDVLNAIYGLCPARAGEVRVQGEKVHISNPRHAISLGIALVTEDRKEYGLVLNMAVRANITLSNLQKYCRGGFIGRRLETAASARQIQALAIKASADQPVKLLSGGNQQKVVLAKALLTQPGILMLDEPTRGIDIGAKAQIYRLIRELAAGGKAILLVSSELPELLALSDRILVMRDGEVSAELNASSASQEQILSYAMPIERGTFAA